VTTLDIDINHRRSNFTLQVTQTLPANGVTAIFGRSGAGKTTLLRMIAGFERSGGEIRFCGELWEDGRRFVPPHRRRVGFVFQNPQLFAHLNVARNLTYAARRSGQMAKVEEMVNRLGLAPLLERAISGLSGGEAQRVALARALLSAPRLLVMDEPLSALDATRRSEILPYIEALRDEVRLPILYISHSLPEVARLASQVLVLADGRVQAFGPTAEVLGNTSSAADFGDAAPGSLIEAYLDGTDPDRLSRLSFSGGTILVPAVTGQPGAKLRLFVQARDILIARMRPEGLSALNVFTAVVESVEEYEDGVADIRLNVGGTTLRARITRRSRVALDLAPGTACYAVLKTVALARE
jgi:molybdate transport system ATP-binding protein